MRYMRHIIAILIACLVAIGCLTPSSFAQSARIPDLVLDGSPAPTDQLIVHKSGDTRAKKTTRSALRSGLSGVGVCSPSTWASTLATEAAPTCTQPNFSDLLGIATVAQGGTGVGTLTAHGVLIGNGTGNVAVTSAGTAGQVLTSNGASADPTFQAAAGGAPSGASYVTMSVEAGLSAETVLALTGPVTSTGMATAIGTNAITDAMVTDTLTASLYAPLAGATFSGAVQHPAGTPSANSVQIVQAGTGLNQPATDVLCAAAGGVNVICTNKVASAVNYIDIFPSATGATTIVQGGGTDATVSVAVRAKSTGNVTLGSNGGDTWKFFGSSGAFSTSAQTTGQVLLAPGVSSATSPVFAFVGDTTTGMGRGAAGETTLISSAVKRLGANSRGIETANGDFAVAGDARGSVLTARNSTSNATPTALFLNGSSTRMTIATDTTWTFSCFVTARRTDADNESAGYKLEGVVDNNAGTTALVGTVTTTILAEDTAAWDVAATADNTNDALIVTVTGETAKTIRWVAVCRTVEVTG